MTISRSRCSKSHNTLAERKGSMQSLHHMPAARILRKHLKQGSRNVLSYSRYGRANMHAQAPSPFLKICFYKAAVTCFCFGNPLTTKKWCPSGQSNTIRPNMSIPHFHFPSKREVGVGFDSCNLLPMRCTRKPLFPFAASANVPKQLTAAPRFNMPII